MNSDLNQTENAKSVSEPSSLALKLRTLRLQKNLSTEMLSQLTKIAEEYIIAFETDKKIPTEEEKYILFEVLR